MADKPTIDTGKQGKMDVADFSAELGRMKDVTKSQIKDTFKSIGDLQKDVATQQIDYTKKIRDAQVEVDKAKNRGVQADIDVERQKLRNLQRQRAVVDSLGKTLEDIEKAEKDRRNKKIDQFGSATGTSGITSLFTGGGFSLLQKALEFIKDLLFGANEQAVKISHAFQVTGEDAERIRVSLLQQSSGETGLLGNLKNRIKAQEELLSNSKLTYIASKDQLDTQIKLVEAMGMSADEASRLNELFTGNNNEGSKGTKIAFDQVALFAKQEGMLFNSKKILQDVSNVSGQIRATYKGSVEELTKAVLQAAKLGTTIEQTKSMSESLLNFESSIDNELKAELLTGQQLNLEKARALALSGKYVDAGKEMLDQAGGLNNFQKLNVIQQNALAAAVGLTSDQMADVLFKQSVQGKQASELATKYRELGAYDMARALESGEIQGDQLKIAQERLTAEREFAESMEQIKSALSGLVTSGTLDRMVSAFQEIAKDISAFVIDLRNGNGLIHQIFFGTSDAAKNQSMQEAAARETQKKYENGEISNDQKNKACCRNCSRNMEGL